MNTRKITLSDDKKTVELSVNPQSVKVDYPQITKNTDLISGEYVEIAEGKLRTTQLETFIPADDSPFKTGSRTQKDILTTLDTWRKNKAVVDLTIGNIDSFAVYVTSISKTVNEGDADVYITLSLTEVPPIVAATLNKGRKKLPIRRRIKKKDTLWSLAKHYYGDASKWSVIYKVKKNRKLIGSNPQKLPVGKKLTIPKRTW